MSKIIGFLKNNWIVLVLVLIIAVLLVRNNLGVSETYYAPKSGSSIEMGYGDVAVDSIASPLAIGGYRGVVGNVAPTEQMDRMVVEDTALSMLVKDVALVIKGIDKLAVESGGYMVNKSISKP